MQKSRKDREKRPNLLFPKGVTRSMRKKYDSPIDESPQLPFPSRDSPIVWPKVGSPYGKSHNSQKKSRKKRVTKERIKRKERSAGQYTWQIVTILYMILCQSMKSKTKDHTFIHLLLDRCIDWTLGPLSSSRRSLLKGLEKAQGKD
jgi:hypothetical protein